MIDVADFLPFVLPSVSGCSDPLAETAVVLAAREFCERTRVWRQVETYDVTTEAEDIICCPSEAIVHEIDRAWLDGCELPRSQFSPGPDGCEPPANIVQQSMPGRLQIRAEREGRLTVAVFLKPAPRAQALPEVLYESFVEVIAAGALAYLFKLPNQDWSNGPLAAANRAQFDQALDANFALNVRGQQRAPVRTRPRYV